MEQRTDAILGWDAIFKVACANVDARPGQKRHFGMAHIE
jgi:hypothetical protein